MLGPSHGRPPVAQSITTVYVWALRAAIVLRQYLEAARHGCTSKNCKLSKNADHMFLRFCDKCHEAYISNFTVKPVTIMVEQTVHSNLTKDME